MDATALYTSCCQIISQDAGLLQCNCGMLQGQIRPANYSTGKLYCRHHVERGDLVRKCISEMNRRLCILSLKFPDMRLFLVLLLSELFCSWSVLLAEAEKQDLQQVRLGLESVLEKPVFVKTVARCAYYLWRVFQNHCSFQENTLK